MPYRNAGFGASPMFQQQQYRIDPRQQLAMMLSQSAEQKQPTTPLGALDKVVSMGLSGMMQGQVMEEQQNRQKAAQDAYGELAKALTPQPEQRISWNTPRPDGTGTMEDVIPARGPDFARAASIALGNPDTASMGMNLLASEQDRMARDAQMARQESQFSRSLAAQEAGRRESLAAQEIARRENIASREEMARQAAADRRALVDAQRAANPRPVQTVTTDEGVFALNSDATLGNRLGGKPGRASGNLPPPVLKMQQQELDAIGTAGAIAADLGAVRDLIDSGKLNVGPIENLASKAKNFAGMSDENSRNFSTFTSTLEKLRNDSLRLNSGVQTEGDAQRAWNELLSNINDPKLVKQRLGEIEKINERAAGLRRMNIDTMRANYGLDPLDVRQYASQEAAIGQQNAPGAPAGSAVAQAQEFDYVPGKGMVPRR